MTSRANSRIAPFLEEHRPAIRQLLERAYAEAGGHYAALTPEARARQAEIDSGEFITDLLREAADPMTIQQTVLAAPTLAADLVNMATALDRLFTAFVTAQLPGDAPLARQVIRRSHYVIARFRLSVSSVQLNSLVRGDEPPGPPAP